METLFAAGLQPLVLSLAGVAGGCVLFGYGFRLWHRKRLIEDVPTAKVRSMALGRVEIFGQAREKHLLTAPLTGQPCAFYRYRVEEEVGSGRHRRWRTVARGDSSQDPFYVEDETGRVRVDPADATLEIRPDLRNERVRRGDPVFGRLEAQGWARRGWFGSARRVRVSEWRIAPGDPLYVLGVAQERGALAAERRRAVAASLAGLKHDPEAFARLDRDGDGHVDGDEWEVARQAALSAVDREAPEDPVVIARAPEGESPFVLSDRPERALVRSLAWRSGASILGGVALSLGSLAVLLDFLTKIGFLGRT